MVLAVPELEQPVFRHTPIAAGDGAIQAHARWLQLIDAQQLPVQGAFKRRPAIIVTQGLQDPCQPVVANVQGMDWLPGAPAQRLESLRGPRFDMAQPMVRFRQDMSQPELGHPAEAEAHPVAMGREVLIQQGAYAHPCQLGQQ